MLRETGIRNDGTDSFIVRFEMKGFFSSMCLRAHIICVYDVCVCARVKKKRTAQKNI
jgi:hypothetical protein